MNLFILSHHAVAGSKKEQRTRRKRVNVGLLNYKERKKILTNKQSWTSKWAYHIMFTVFYSAWTNAKILSCPCGVINDDGYDFVSLL